jgi:hypothetical protein
MALAGGGSEWQNGYFTECPKCHKKGFYKPRSMLLGRKQPYKVMSFPKTCKYCRYKEEKEKN